jgi:hypothetical protein
MRLACTLGLAWLGLGVSWEFTPHNKAPQMHTGTAWALRLAVWSVERGQQLTGEAGGW